MPATNGVDGELYLHTPVIKTAFYRHSSLLPYEALVAYMAAIAKRDAG
jgi:hypothetical protein